LAIPICILGYCIYKTEEFCKWAAHHHKGAL
jgi:hypothetical protein